MQSLETLSRQELAMEIETCRKKIAELEEQLAGGIFSNSHLQQTVFDILPVGVVITDAKELQILDVNLYAAKLIGLPQKEIIGQNSRTFLTSSDEHRKERFQKSSILTFTGEKIPVLQSSTSYIHQGRKVFFESFVDSQGIPTATEVLNLSRALKKSESNFRAVLESVNEFIWAVDIEKGLLYWNPAFAAHMKRFFSVTLEKGQMVKDLIPPQLGDFWEQIYQKGIGGQTLTFEYKTIDGRNQLTTVNPLRREGVIVGCSFFAMDVSNLKRIEVQLRESEEMFRAIFDNQHMIMLVIDPDTGRIEEANQAAAQFYGYSVDELMDMVVTDLNVLAKHEIEAEMGLAVEQDKKQFSFRHRLADGKIRDVEAFIGPITVHKRNFLYLIIQDVTEQRRIEADLQQITRIVSSTPDMVSLVGQNYVLQMVNDSYLKAYVRKREELIGKAVVEVVGKEFFEQTVQKHLDKAFAGVAVEYESWMDFPALGRRFMSMACNPVYGLEKEILGVAVDARDITSLKQAEDDLQRVFDSSLDMLCVVGFDGWFKRLNPAWEKTLGWSEAEMKGHLWFHFVHEEDLQATVDAGKQLAAGQSITDFINRFFCKDGSLRWISWNSYPDISRREIFAVARDVTENKRMEEELRRLATTDALTGVANRRHFLEHAEQELKRSLRYNSFPVLLSLDIDHFKKINDTYGHDAGDQALIAFVHCCMTAMRSSDLFGRIGGEEFLALLTNSDLESGWLTAQRLRLAISDLKLLYKEQTICFTVSIGLTLFQGTGDTLDQMMIRADRALYAAKAAGRNQVVQELGG
ncbi:MAG: PAS domain S-box protein [Proteobacteria bacterium]|nr:PAS domain S-box protein [Pseudomonadota bacterium]MBU1231318.1 PAS domain S-box protein [Pseudomonadota bacterium]